MDDVEFEGFVAASAARLHNLAFALTSSHASAQDLTQTTLEKVYRAWRKRAPDDPVAYSTTTLVRAYYSERRLYRNVRERAADPHQLAQQQGLDARTVDGAGVTDERLLVQAALERLATRQREAVVLRFLEDLPVAEVAKLMGCSPGNVKRLCHDGLGTLRRSLEKDELRGTAR